MTLLSAWALCGLVLLAPLIIAHLRREQRPLHDVPSLALWDELEEGAGRQTRQLRLPRLPLLLALQALALILLVAALARPTGAAPAPRPTQVDVLDDSLWMSAADRLPAAEQRLSRLAAALPAGGKVALVVAAATPRVAYSGPPAGLARALAAVQPGSAPSTLAPALALSAGLLAAHRDRVIVVHAPEDPVPPVTAPAGLLTGLVVGGPVADQGIFAPTARCGIGAADRCEVMAEVDNHSPIAVADRYTASADGSTLSGTVRLAAGATGDIVLSARPDEVVALRLAAGGAVAADDRAWVSVPGPSGTPPPETVTLVGAPSDAVTVARAFAAVPGVSLRLRTPESFRAADATTSTLTVLDGWLPPHGLPASPSVLLIDPPTLPGGHVGGALHDGVVSGTDGRSALLAGVDLTSLSLNAGAGRALTLAPYESPVAWSPDGPLIAVGDDGVQRIAVLAFDPAQSDLPQLASFPILAANLVSWSAGWAPPAASAGEPLRIDATPGARTLVVRSGGQVVATQRLRGVPATVTLPQPGVYSVDETGPQVNRAVTVAVSIAAPSGASAPAAPAAAPVVLAPAAGSPPQGGGGTGIITWLLVAALVVLMAEWAYWRSQAPRMAAA